MPPPLTLVHTGSRYVVVAKPAGISVEAYADHDTVEARAWAQFKRPNSPKKPYVGIVHRLDRPVSGLLLLARNKSTLRHLNEQFANGQVKKSYLARTQVPLNGVKGKLEHYLTRAPGGRRAVALDDPAKGAKLSMLTYELVGEGKGYFEYRIHPITGRYHQIRVQLATAGAPIIGDATYGSPLPYHPSQIMLHATRLRFTDPIGELVHLKLPPAWLVL